MKKRDRQDSESMHLLTYFLAFVFILLLFSVLLKGIIVFAKSSFDGNHRYTIAVIFSAKKADIISISPQEQIVSILRISSRKNLGNLQQTLFIPIDATIKNPPFTQSDNSAPHMLFSSLINYRSIQTNLTIIDLFRLFFASRVSTANLKIEDMSLPIDQADNDKLVANLFRDIAVSNENVTIQIVNTTSVPGLGNRLARLITNMGGEVVSVESGNQNPQNSTIAARQDSYTKTKLQKILQYKIVKMQSESISDIIITIGEDSSSSNKF